MSTIDHTEPSPWLSFAEAYQHQEAWKRDHNLAMVCRDCEELIATGVFVFKFLKEREDHWRDQVFRGTVEFTDQRDESFRRAYQLWVMTTKAILNELVDDIERQFDEVDGADALRRMLPAAEATLRDWRPPRLSRAVGLRDHDLTEDAAVALGRILSSTAPLPYVPQNTPVPERSAEEFKRRLKQ